VRLAAALRCSLALLAGCNRTAASLGSSPPRPTAEDRGTGAVDSVPVGRLAGQHFSTVVELLQGQVAGLEVIQLPKGDVSLRIRGINSLRGDGEPLLVIDGIPVASQRVNAALKALRPAEIASIRVLKDVSSTSVYGMLGANGVILITTKRD
jgi:TonB-dependent starch-binding outer membrane protein SusC